MAFDYVIVGCGLFGAVFARLMAEAGRSALLVDRRNHIGGNCFTREIEGIQVHEYGPHIFHTSNARVWNFVNRFAEFHRYTHRTVVNHKNKLYSFPINLMTCHQLWGVTSPQEAAARIERERVPCESPKNCEEWMLAQVGRELYETFIQGYTAKQWNRDPKDLPASIVRRIPIRLTYNDRYFDDTYEGIPIGGYTRLFENLLDHRLIEIESDVDYFAHVQELQNAGTRLVFTGKIDEFYDYRFGRLEYRSLRFEHETVSGDFQGNAIVNYTDRNVPYTRITEHKHFEGKSSLPKSVITREYPQDYTESRVPYYPIRDEKNTAIYEKYRSLGRDEKVIFGGRLATYQYYDMHQVIAQALVTAERELGSTAPAAIPFRRAA
jgi:UDP-galactopyranose mutase